MFSLPDFDWVDLTRPYSEAVAGFQSSVAKTLERDGWNAWQLEIYSHAGTHMDAPVHFGVNEQTIEQYPLHRLMGRAWKVSINLREASQLLTVADLGNLPTRWQPGDNLLLHTGWSDRHGSPGFRNELPRLSPELAQWCVDQQVNILGVEPPSVADVNHLPEVTAIHQVLLGGEVIIVEGLVNLARLPEEAPCWLLALPLNIQGGDGAPARVLAGLPR